MKLIPLCIVAVFLCLGMGNAIAGANAPTVAGPFIKSVTLKAPATCKKDGNLTVSVTVCARLAWNVEVKLYEQDVLLNDLIETKTIVRALDEGQDWEETITFTFQPKKYEIGKTLELFAKTADAKSNVVRVTCR